MIRRALIVTAAVFTVYAIAACRVRQGRRIVLSRLPDE